MKGTMPARMMIGSKACVPAACRASEKYPTNLKATIVPSPAPVPPSPLTDATDSL